MRTELIRHTKLWLGVVLYTRTIRRIVQDCCVPYSYFVYLFVTYLSNINIWAILKNVYAWGSESRIFWDDSANTNTVDAGAICVTANKQDISNHGIYFTW